MKKILLLALFPSTVYAQSVFVAHNFDKGSSSDWRIGYMSDSFSINNFHLGTIIATGAGTDIRFGFNSVPYFGLGLRYSIFSKKSKIQIGPILTYTTDSIFADKHVSAGLCVSYKF